MFLVYFDTEGVVLKKCSEKFCKIFMKHSVLEFLFKQNWRMQDCNFVKKKLGDRFSVNSTKFMLLILKRSKIREMLWNVQFLSKRAWMELEIAIYKIFETAVSNYWNFQCGYFIVSKLATLYMSILYYKDTRN